MKWSCPPLATALVTAGAVTSALVASGGVAGAQVDRRYDEEPTVGLRLPLVPLAGELDARTTVANPGGLRMVEGGSLALQLDASDPDHVGGAGDGVGGFLVPWAGFGLGLEALTPPRTELVSDPGTPLRLTVAHAASIRPGVGLGLAWHHTFDDGPLGGLDTLDLGLAARFGNHLAGGLVARDLLAQEVAGTAAPRRFEAEATVRPLGTDRLDLALGARLGHGGEDLDGWLRVRGRVVRGVFALAGVESRAVRVVETSPAGQRSETGRDLSASLGLELSFGPTGVSALGHGRVDETDARHPVGGSLALRWSPSGPASVLGPRRRIERIELGGGVGTRELTSILLRLRQVARDPGARAVVVTFDGIAAGWASLQELHRELLRVRAAGKQVFAYLVTGTTRDYFVASAATKIFVDPAGGLRLLGMAGTVLYYKGAFDMIGVEPQFERIAEYKSAPESFTDTGPSEPARRMRDALYDGLWKELVAAIAAGRKLSPAEVEAALAAGPYTAGDLAKDTRLVDAVVTPDKVAELVAEALGELPPVAPPRPESLDRWQAPGIAVIYADGDIVDGKSRVIPVLGRKLVGGETIAQAIASARADRRVEAIVLRIDSPGGSAVASEMMAREVFKTRGVKPILCSMGDIAASGGYFLAAGCDLVFAEPMTITGSIGIFYGKFAVTGLASKLGVGISTYTRGARADMDSMYRPFTTEERAVVREKLEYLYGRFVGAVAEGRGLTKAEVDAVGRGHVWTGADAVGAKLVDRLGGLGETLDEAKRRIGLGPDDRVQLIALPRTQVSVLGRLVGRVLGAAAQAQEPTVDLRELAPIRALLDAVPASVLADPDAAQARLPFAIEE
ncbi:MAG: signal peptide peptidase SppA [Kofleriaceae bacterium]|nr:signal peptide peptidase SppA [Kofleriaceae bacterium]MBP6839036.1 signal peptide peptidase SppA [Kofleriaceae bacterium]MBP9203844.1 signal peptide peptidase SppA [Kofleriaceae bacterium]